MVCRSFFHLARRTCALFTLRVHIKEQLEGKKRKEMLLIGLQTFFFDRADGAAGSIRWRFFYTQSLACNSIYFYASFFCCCNLGVNFEGKKQKSLCNWYPLSYFLYAIMFDGISVFYFLFPEHYIQLMMTRITNKALCLYIWDDAFHHFIRFLFAYHVK